MSHRHARRGGRGAAGLSRREFIEIAGAAAAGAAAGGLWTPRRVLADGLTGRVIHVYDPHATDWDFSTGWWGDHIQQRAVDHMVNHGLALLTGRGSVTDAWAALIPGFTPGDKIAIKVNFNNYYNHSEPDEGDAIDSVIEPINSLIRGLLAFGFAAEDISVYDVTNAWHDGKFPQRFIQGCDHPGIHFVQYVGNSNPFSGTQSITWNPPSGPGISDCGAIANVVVEADYLINVPIAKFHDFTGVTLGFKNHYGSFQRCQNTHEYLQTGAHYVGSYSPMVDVYRNTHFREKTVLTLTDALFGNWRNSWSAPYRWTLFGNGAANSLFFSTDPVAVDCVVADFIRFERAAHSGEGVDPLPDSTYDPLYVASQSPNNLGTYEKALSAGSYATIAYHRFDVSEPGAAKWCTF